MGKTLLQKVWDAHAVRTLPTGQTQLFIGLHLIHEVTTPQAFQMLKDAKLKVAASIQGDAVRISGAKKDELQAAIQLVRTSVTDIPLQFINFRD